MKISINKNILLTTLEQVIKAIDSLNVFLDLRSFYFEVKGDELIVIGSDSNLSIMKVIKSNGENIFAEKEVNKALFPASLLLSLIRKCSGIIELEIIKTIAYFKNNGNKFEINIQSAEEYPLIDFNLYGKKVCVDAKKLKETIKNVSFAAGVNESEIIYNGVNIVLEGNKIVFSATDKHRLSTEFLEIKDLRNLDFNITVFAKNLRDLIPENAEGIIDVYVSDFKINIVYDGLISQSKIIDAPYKDLSGIFQQEFRNKLVVDKKKLLDALSTSNFVNPDALSKTRFEISKDVMKIISVREQFGKSEVLFRDYVFDGEELIITFSYKYLKEAISVFDGEIIICFNGQHDNILILGKSNPNNKQLVAPQRTY